MDQENESSSFENSSQTQPSHELPTSVIGSPILLNKPPQEYSSSPLSSTPIVDENVTPPAPTKKKGKLLLPIILSLLIFLFSTTGVFAYLVVSEKINIKDEKIRNILYSFAYKIPFVPKSPEYILKSSALAHQKLSRNSFDVSLALSSNDFVEQLGSSDFEFQLKGYADFENLENPRLSANLDLSNQLSLEFRKLDDTFYLKANKLPLFLSTYLGVDKNHLDSVMENWISYTSTPLNTEAKKNLPTPASSPLSDSTKQLFNNLLNEKVLPLITVSTEDLDSVPTYRLSFVPTSEQLDEIIESLDSIYYSSQDSPKSPKLPQMKYSDMVKNFSVTLWINQKDYYINKSIITMNLVNSSSTPTTPYSTLTPQLSEAAFAFVIKLSDYGLIKDINLPPKSLTAEEYIELIMSKSRLYQNPSPALSNPSYSNPYTYPNPYPYPFPAF